jgi:hypothetical protein
MSTNKITARKWGSRQLYYDWGRRLTGLEKLTSNVGGASMSCNFSGNTSRPEMI